MTLSALKRRDTFGRRYVTAFLLTSDRRQHEAPIKHRITDRHWLAEVGGRMYMCEYDPAQVYTKAGTAAAAARFAVYDLSGYRPLSKERAGFISEYLQKIWRRGEAVRAEGKATKLQRMLRRKAPEPPADLPGMARAVLPARDVPIEVRDGMTELIDSWNRDEVVRPVRMVSTLISDMNPADPAFVGSCVRHSIQAKDEYRRLSNETRKKLPWMLIAVLIIGLGAALVLALAYEAGAFGNMGGGGITIPGLEGLGGPAAQQDTCSADAIAQRYPDEMDLRIAVDTGAETCPIPDFMKQKIDAFDDELVAWVMDTRGMGAP